jgi:hypothetical protein
MTKAVITDDRTFNELGTEEKLAVLVLRCLEAGVAPNQVRTIAERVIAIHQAVDNELIETRATPAKAYGHLKVMK